MKYFVDIILIATGVVIYHSLFGKSSFIMSDGYDFLFNLLPAVIVGFGMKYVIIKYLLKSKRV